MFIKDLITPLKWPVFAPADRHVGQSLWSVVFKLPLRLFHLHAGFELLTLGSAFDTLDGTSMDGQIDGWMNG